MNKIDDTISRQAAISAICSVRGKIDCDKMDKCEKLQLPPANNSEIPNSSDTISRAKAIEALDKRFDSIPMEQTSEILMLRKDLRELPPASNSEIPNSSDTISRQAAIEAVNCVMVMKGIRSGKGITAEAVDCAKRIIADNIRQLPPIQPEPKRGRWIYKTDLVTAPTGYWECSECKEGRLLYEENFCPHCGADMREVTT